MPARWVIYQRRLEELARRIEADVEDRERALPEILKSTGDLSNIPTHTADHAAEELDAEIEAARVQGQLRDQISSALKRILDGTFGQCVECGKKVPAERLQAIPYASHCIQCERKLEMQLTGGGSFSRDERHR